MPDADLNFGEDFALMSASDGAPVEFEGYHFAPDREPVFIHFRHRGHNWLFQVYEASGPSAPSRNGAILFEERGLTKDNLNFAQGADFLRECLQRWRDEEAKRSLR